MATLEWAYRSGDARAQTPISPPVKSAAAGLRRSCVSDFPDCTPRPPWITPLHYFILFNSLGGGVVPYKPTPHFYTVWHFYNVLRCADAIGVKVVLIKIDRQDPPCVRGPRHRLELSCLGRPMSASPPCSAFTRRAAPRVQTDLRPDR